MDTLNKITRDLAGKVVEFIKNCVEGPRGYRIGLINITTDISYFNLN